MILRGVATVALVGLLSYNALLPKTGLGRRGTEAVARSDVEHGLAIGQRLPELRLFDLDGRAYTREDLLGHRVLLTFERSVDW